MDDTTTELTGCDKLRQWLTEQGFKISRDHMPHRFNVCNWYAYRRTSLEARECECNDSRPPLVVRPYLAHADSEVNFESIEVEVVGESGELWFKLAAYSLPVETLMERLSEIESALTSAWNAAMPAPSLPADTQG